MKDLLKVENKNKVVLMTLNTFKSECISGKNVFKNRKQIRVENFTDESEKITSTYLVGVLRNKFSLPRQFSNFNNPWNICRKDKNEENKDIFKYVFPLTKEEYDNLVALKLYKEYNIRTSVNNGVFVSVLKE